MSVSHAVMGHPSRQKFIDKLVPKLPGAQVVLDEKNDRWETGRRALLAYDSSADFHCVTQDDAVLCRDYTAGIELVAAAAGGQPVGLYIGKPRPYGDVVIAALSRARAEKRPWLEMEGPWWGVAIIIPTAHIDELVEWGDANGRIKNYDRRISAWYEQQGMKCRYTVPSLVDHRGVTENPSLIRGRTGNRHAHYFIGRRRSPLDIDWSVAPVQPATKVTYRHYRTRQEQTVTANSPRQTRLSRSRYWEVV